jgi:hypothetical protein
MYLSSVKVIGGFYQLSRLPNTRPAECRATWFKP